MHYLTDRKRAVGLGAAKSGTAHHWSMTISATALLVLIPLFIFTFGSALGGTYEEILAYYSRPFPAIVAGLTFLVGMKHFADGAQVMIDDYVHGFTGKVTLVVVRVLAYATAAVGIFAVARLAL
jgi:succinate dehydrogenase / fumarate reductase, membrane anchor subunit